MAGEQRDWENLRRTVRAERARRELSQAALAARSGFGVSTLRKIEHGTWRSQNPWDVLAGLDRGLRWEPGSAERVLCSGGQPIAIPDPPDPDLARIQQAFPRLPAAVRQVLADVAERYRP